MGLAKVTSKIEKEGVASPGEGERPQIMTRSQDQDLTNQTKEKKNKEENREQIPIMDQKIPKATQKNTQETTQEIRENTETRDRKRARPQWESITLGSLTPVQGTTAPTIGNTAPTQGTIAPIQGNTAQTQENITPIKGI